MRLRALAPLFAVCGLLIRFAPDVSADLPPVPFRMHAFAVNMTNVGTGGTATIEITINNWSTDALRTQLTTAMVDNGQNAMMDVLRKAPIVGRLQLPGLMGPDPQNLRLGWDLRYAHRQALPDGGDEIVIGTDRVMSMWEVRNQPRSVDYPLLLMQIHMPKEGKGEGRMFAATQIKFDKKKNTIEFEQFSAGDLRLNEITAEKR